MRQDYQGLPVLTALLARLRKNSLQPVGTTSPGQLGHGLGMPTYLNAKQLQPKAPRGPQPISQTRLNQAMLNSFRAGKPFNITRMLFGKLPLGGKI